MWVVGCRTGGETVFADNDWNETELLKKAQKFESQSDAVLCAASMTATVGGKWMAVKLRVALRW